MTTMDYNPKALSGRNKRLLHEWRKLEHGLAGRSDISWSVVATNSEGLPIRYHIDYHIHSICGVTNLEHLNEAGVVNEPLYSDHYQMLIDLPAKYPCVDGVPAFCFLTADANGQAIPHPWHPNIRYFGDFAGRVCINMADTYTGLLWGIERVAGYLHYDCYHALAEPPYPEDLQVAAWVLRQGEPNGWIPFNDDKSE